ncbi:MAG: redox-regulated ATPase YchF [Patescibacteria group bacterium]
MNKLSIGIIGLPNVGKSTLFKLLTKKEVNIANYPFCTIDPNIGVVTVPDGQLEKLAQMSQSEKIIPAVVEFYDIAGLVKGANKGEGLGNKFLSHIREVNAIVEVLRIFKDEDIIHVENSVDPIRDLEIIDTELKLKDLESKEKINLLAIKPKIYFINGKEEDMSQALKDKINNEGSAYIVSDLKESPDMSFLIKEAYKILNLISFFTTGEKETRAWTIIKGSKAPQAAGVIHTDFEKKFIRAEVINNLKLLEAGGWQQAKTKGWIRLEGKDYIVQEGDVLVIRHG